MMDQMMNKLLLIDGNSIMNRGYFALPKTLTAKNGIHTNAILGFLNIFYKIYEEEQPTNIVVAFDLHEPTFRHKMYEEYKGTRHAMEDELREQFLIIKDILGRMKITIAEKGGYEADDIIGTYSRRGMEKGMNVTILSGDRDLLQLATDKVLVRIPKTKAGKTTVENYYEDDVINEYGVTPLEFIDMKGLMGDTSDNIPGVQGIGPKTASSIIQKYHTIENALEHIDEIKPDKARKNLDEMRDMALFSRTLATIMLDAPLDKEVEDTSVTYEDIFGQDVYDIYMDLGLKSQLKRFDDIKEIDTGVRADKIPELKPEDIEYKALIEIIKKEAPLIIGLEPFMVNNDIYGAAVCISDRIYIVSGNEITGIKKDIKNTTIALISIKEYIDYFDFEMTDDLFDVSVAAYLLDPLNDNYTYDYLADKYLDIVFEDEKTIIGKEEVSIFSLGLENYRKLMAYKAYTAASSVAPVMDKLKELDEYTLYKDIEYPTIFVLRSMERYGVCVDRGILEAYGAELDKKIETLTNDIYKEAGEEFNINSPKQLGVVLFEHLGLKSAKKTKSGYSTNVEVLNKLKDEHEIIPLILEYRTLSKLKSTYVEGLLSCIKSDGRIHTCFNQTVTATGRLSSTEPNLQNIPARSAKGREIRKAFIPSEGNVFVDADYSQIELRVMASVSGDQALIDAFNSSKDIHAITASQVFNVEEKDVTPDLRRRAKAVNFGIIYGISSFGLGEDLGISRKEAKEYIDKYFETYGRVKEYLDECISNAKKTGYVRSMLGRIRPIPELYSSNFMQRSFGERVAMNSPIQGTAADIIKIAMINVFKEIKQRGLKARLILQIHDELLIEAPENEVEVITELLKRNMEEAVTMAVHLYVDVHTGATLSDAK